VATILVVEFIDLLPFNESKKLSLFSQIFENRSRVPTIYRLPPNNYSRAFRSLIRNHNKELQAIEEEKGKIPKGSYYLPIIRLYDGRHSFATNNILNGEANAKIISKIMGSNVETIMRNYVHVGETMHQTTLSKYSNKIFNISDAKKNNINDKQA
jgi:integrase